jgi:fatty acyl-CoA reductase
MATTLQKFYQGKVVLVTGASGFLGKVLLMKLLQSCPDFKRIIVLLRRKNEDSCSDRLSKLLSNPVSVTCLSDI